MELGAAGRALFILETLSMQREVNLETLSASTGLPKATALRLLNTLTNLGYVSRNSSDMYSLTLKMFTVGSRALKHINLLDAAKPVADNLRDSFGETVHMGILENNHAVYVLKEECNYTLRMYSRVGKSMPLFCTSIGKCLLAAQSEEFIDSYIQNSQLKPFTPKTVYQPEELKKELEKVRTQGYAFDNEEHESGIVCIGSPIRDSNGETVAAMSVSFPVFRLDKSQMDNIGKQVKASCDKISSILGFVD